MRKKGKKREERNERNKIKKRKWKGVCCRGKKVVVMLVKKIKAQI